jgi:hypothetical protein
MGILDPTGRQTYENNRHNAFIEMCFDFTEDLAELEQPVEYPAFTAEATA